jgi:hypothetical protein
LSANLDDTLARFVDGNGICKACGHDHSFKPDLGNVNTSIDIISELFGKHRSAKPEEILKQHV